MIAAGREKIEIIEELLKAGANLNTKNIDGQRAIDFIKNPGKSNITVFLIPKIILIPKKSYI